MEVTLSGNIADLPFAGAAAFLVRQKATGVLEIDDGDGVSRAFFLDGHPQGAKLGHVTYPLGRVLAEAKRISETALAEALAKQRDNGKLLGQILLERGAIDETTLQQAFQEQSRLSFLSLFGAKTGRYDFLSGLVHLTDFTSAPLGPLLAIYLGVRDFAPTEIYEGLLAHLAFAAVSTTPIAEALLAPLTPAERDIAKRLSEPQLCAALARETTLSTKALGALLFALYSLGLLRIESPHRAPR